MGGWSHFFGTWTATNGLDSYEMLWADSILAVLKDILCSVSIWVYLVGGSATDVFGKNQGSIATTQNMTIPQRWPKWSAFASGFPYLPNIVGYSYILYIIIYIYISISHDVSV
jgi:hypothetical protein